MEAIENYILRDALASPGRRGEVDKPDMSGRDAREIGRRRPPAVRGLRKFGIIRGMVKCFNIAAVLSGRTRHAAGA